MIGYTASYTDLYQLSMAQVYFETGRMNETAVFDYFFRRLPFDWGYAVFCGLETLLDVVEELRFDDRDLDFLRENGFSEAFLKYLKTFRFTGQIDSSREGDLVFPTRPILQVEAPLIEAQILETLLLNILNYQTLVATKASRMQLVAGSAKLADFGLRRAQGPAGYYGARAAVVGGFAATSNVRAAMDFNLKATGTMAHSFVQSYEKEIDAFRDFALNWPDKCVLLVDTYNTIKSGVPNAIAVAREMEKRGQRLKGIRLDSGDLAYLAKESRKMLDNAGLDYVKIAASNQLDEKVIKSLQEQEAPIDLFGVGTSLIIGSPDAVLDGVYKLSELNHQPSIKLSETIQKISIPGKKQVYRVEDDMGEWIGADVVAKQGEDAIAKMYDPFDSVKSLNIDNYHKQPLLTRVMESGKRITPERSPAEIAEFTHKQLQNLPDEYKRFENPHVYKVGLSGALHALRNQLIQDYKKEAL
ncbi:MAG: nicotinate phosphoribosyltransferase [Candidatus Rifleibacteriota bacterium]